MPAGPSSVTCAGVRISRTSCPPRPPTPAHSPGRRQRLGLTLLELLLNHTAPFVELVSDFGKEPTLVLPHKFFPFD